MSDTQLKIRIDNGLKVQLQAAATANGVSLNSEVRIRLTQSLRRPFSELGDMQASMLAAFLLRLASDLMARPK
jgi:hypothetical protein